MNKVLLSILAIAAISTFLINSESNLQKQLFQQWSKKLGKQFSEDQITYRFKVFSQNLKFINQHNSKIGKQHTLGLNLFSFLTHQQFKAQYLNDFKKDGKINVQQTKVTGPIIDWVSYGAVSPVKAQGQCGATYAFSAVGALQALSVITYKVQAQLSVQQVIDCSRTYGNYGCSSGTMQNVFNYVKNVGINTQSAYPYKAYEQSCMTNTGMFKNSGWWNINDCTTLANALAKTAISVAVDGNNFQFYNSGIFYNCNTNLSLGVLLVGMTDSYWTLKNSWGTTWGQKGYIRIGRGNTCGVCSAGSYPV